jgi:hypothetical protein
MQIVPYVHFTYIGIRKQLREAIQNWKLYKNMTFIKLLHVFYRQATQFAFSSRENRKKIQNRFFGLLYCLV